MESNLVEKRKRPGWVWVISVFYFFTTVGALFHFCFYFSGIIPLPAAERAYFESLTLMDWGLYGLAVLLPLVGTVLLFCLRKQSFYFFALHLALNILTTVWHIFIKGVVLIGIIGALIGWGIVIAICVYIKRLEKAGVLN